MSDSFSICHLSPLRAKKDGFKRKFICVLSKKEVCQAISEKPDDSGSHVKVEFNIPLLPEFTKCTLLNFNESLTDTEFTKNSPRISLLEIF